MNILEVLIGDASAEFVQIVSDCLRNLVGVVDVDLREFFHCQEKLDIVAIGTAVQVVVAGSFDDMGTRDWQFHAYHKALIVRRGYKRAIVATAHKLARTVFAVLRDAQPYRDPEVDYEALVIKRNAPRWPAKLAEFGNLELRDDGTMTVNWANSQLPRWRPRARGHKPGQPVTGPPSPHTARTRTVHTSLPRIRRRCPCAWLCATPSQFHSKPSDDAITFRRYSNLGSYGKNPSGQSAAEDRARDLSPL